MSIVTAEGFYRDRVTDRNGRTIFDSGWQKNIVVLPGRVLLAAFVKNEANALGIRSMQLGRGDPTWDTPPTPTPDPNTTLRLTDNAPFTIPLANLTLQYLDAADQVIITPTNRVQIGATLGPGQPAAATDPPVPLREFGMFGQLNGVPQLIDYVRHPLIEKVGALTLERKVRMVF
jgi:hypothetical protein